VFSFSCLYYRFSKWVRVHWRHQAPSGCLPRCYLSLNPHLSWHFTVGHPALRAVAWPPTGLPSRPNGRSVWLQIVCWTGQHAPPPTAVELRHYQSAEDAVHAVTCTSLHPCSLVFSCKWLNWKRFNSLTDLLPMQCAVIPVFSCVEHADDTLFAGKMDAPWILPGCWL